MTRELFTLVGASFSIAGRACRLEGAWEPGAVQLRVMVSRGGEKVPAFDGRGAHFMGHWRQAHLWVRTARAEMPARASFLILHMQAAPRQVCIAEGDDILGRSDGVSKISSILRNFCAPEVADAIPQQVARYPAGGRESVFRGTR